MTFQGAISSKDFCSLHLDCFSLHDDEAFLAAARQARRICIWLRQVLPDGSADTAHVATEAGNRRVQDILLAEKHDLCSAFKPAKLPRPARKFSGRPSLHREELRTAHRAALIQDRGAPGA